MKIYLIRHTKVGVEPGICYGQSDVPLALSYKEDMNRVAYEVEDEEFDKIFSSPLSRCKLLAERLFEDGSINYDERLKELNFGDWEMMTWDAIFELPEGKAWMNNYLEEPCSNGEFYNDLLARVKEFYKELLEQDLNEVAIVSHAGVIRALKSVIEGARLESLFENFKLDYGQVICLETPSKL